MGKRSVIFDVDLYVGWGTPDDFNKYELMEKVFKKAASGGMNAEDRMLLPKWESYFNKILGT